MKWSLVLCTTVVFIVGLCAAVFSQTEASSASTTKGEAIFAHKCVTCHGNDGAGTPVGKSLKVADLRSVLVQRKSDATLSHSISGGKNGMPSFGNDLTSEDIRAVVLFVRTLKIEKK